MPTRGISKKMGTLASRHPAFNTLKPAVFPVSYLPSALSADLHIGFYMLAEGTVTQNKIVVMTFASWKFTEERSEILRGK